MKKAICTASLVIVSVLASACGGGIGGSSAKMDLKIGGKDSTLSVKTSGSNKSVKTFTDLERKVTTATSFTAVTANFDMDTTNLGTMRKPLTSADQIRVLIQLIGEEGTDDKSEFKAGKYKADPTGKFMKLDSVIVSSFADGKETNVNLDTQFSGSKITGQVDVTSVTADSISGTIDVTEGDKSIKGSFTAKIVAKK